MTFESLLNNSIYLRTRYSSQNLLGEWEYAYSSSSILTKCRIAPLTASERIDSTGLFDNVKFKCYCLASSSINRDSQVMYNNELYRVKEVIIDSSSHHKTGLLQLIT
jgi:hypothetical protein